MFALTPNGAEGSETSKGGGCTSKRLPLAGTEHWEGGIGRRFWNNGCIGYVHVSWNAVRVRGIGWGSEGLPCHIKAYAKQTVMQGNTDAILEHLSIHLGENTACNRAAELDYRWEKFSVPIILSPGGRGGDDARLEFSKNWLDCAFAKRTIQMQV